MIVQRLPLQSETVGRSFLGSRGASVNPTAPQMSILITQRTLTLTGALIIIIAIASSTILVLFRYLATNFSRILEIVTDIKESGNIYYKRGEHVTATRKYRKCCKYIKLLRDTMGQTDDDEEKL